MKDAQFNGTSSAARAIYGRPNEFIDQADVLNQRTAIYKSRNDDEATAGPETDHKTPEYRGGLFTQW